MPSPHKRIACFLTIKMLLLSLLCAQGRLAKASVHAGQQQQQQQQQPDPPIEMVGLIAMLAKGMSGGDLLEGILERVQQRGVSFRLTEANEREIRRVGRGLGAQGLDRLIQYVRMYYHPATVDETLLMSRGKTQEIDYLGFKATYVAREGDDYLINVQYKDVNPSLRTHRGCQHDFKVGSRDLTLHIIETSPSEVKAKLLNRVEPRITLKDNDADTDSLEPKATMYLAPCVPLSLQLINENHTDLRRISLPPYYISEPITVGVLRLYGKMGTLHTRIPPGAKDTDPVTEIYYDDATHIAMKFDLDLPTVEQWINAYQAGVLRLASHAELVINKGGDPLKAGEPYVVQQADSKFPNNTSLSSSIAINALVKSSEPLKGMVRLVHLASKYPKKVRVPKQKAVAPDQERLRWMPSRSRRRLSRIWLR